MECIVDRWLVLRESFWVLDVPEEFINFDSFDEPVDVVFLEFRVYPIHTHLENSRVCFVQGYIASLEMLVSLDEGCELLKDVHCHGWPGMSLPQTLIFLVLRIALIVPVARINVHAFKLFLTLHSVFLW